MERDKKRGKGLDSMINAQDKGICARVLRKKDANVVRTKKTGSRINQRKERERERANGVKNNQ